MQSTRRTAVRLFPADSFHTAFISKNILHRNAGSGASIARKSSSGDLRQQVFDYPGNSDLFILPNGYFFRYQIIEAKKKDQNETTTAIHCRTVLGSVFFQNDNRDMPVDDFIDPSMAAMLTDHENETTICGVNKDHTEIFSYSFLRTAACLQMQPAGISAVENRIGTSIYQVADPNKKVIAVAGCPMLGKNYLVIAFNDGEVIVGNVLLNRFNTKFTIHPKFKNFTDLTLSVSPNGMVVAHFPDIHSFRVFDLKTNLEILHPNNEISTKPVITDEPIYNVHISPDGRYYTGLQLKDGHESDLVHCYDLQTGEHSTLFLHEPVVDFVVGDKNQTGAIMCRRLDAKSLENVTLLEPGHIDALLKHGKKPVKINPDSKKKHLPHLHGFLFRQKSSDDDLNEKRTTVSRYSRRKK